MLSRDTRERLAIAIPLGIALVLAWSFRLLGFRDAVITLFAELTSSPASAIPIASLSHPLPTSLPPPATSSPIPPHDQAAFIQTATDVEFPAPFDYAPLREVCGRTAFRDGLVFTCEGQHGGIGMLRNQMLKCIRYAIHGGGALVIPSIALRNKDDLKDIETATEMPLDYLLERDTFRQRLQQGCPGLVLYDRVEDFSHYSINNDNVQRLHVLGDQFEPDHPPTGLRHPRAWRRVFDAWLAEQAVVPSADRPVHIMMEQSFLEYPVRDDGDAFVHEFGKVLSFRRDTRALAAAVLYALAARFSLPIDPARAINPHAYYGAHLRLESDAIWAWPPAEWRFSRMADQFDAQYRHLQRTGLAVVYVASGNTTVVHMFDAYIQQRLRREGSPLNVTVVMKQDLLGPADRQALAAMTFDQQALVDFMVMFKASAFMGVAHSSFPWNVALRRHELSRYRAYANQGSDLLRDEYSTIMGMAADYPYVDSFVTSIWP